MSSPDQSDRALLGTHYPLNPIQSDHADLVRRLYKRLPGFPSSFMHAAVGIAGESGELLDVAKKHWVYNKPFDRDHAIEEMGDIEFYMEAARKLIGVSRDQVLQANMDKLNKRYPSGIYTDEHAQARLDKASDPGQA